MKYNNLILLAISFLFAGMSLSMDRVQDLSIQDNYIKAKELFDKEDYCEGEFIPGFHD